MLVVYGKKYLRIRIILAQKNGGGGGGCCFYYANVECRYQIGNDITEILLKVALNCITLILKLGWPA